MKTTFLQGENIDCELFVLPPKETSTEAVHPENGPVK